MQFGGDASARRLGGKYEQVLDLGAVYELGHWLRADQVILFEEFRQTAVAFNLENFVQTRLPKISVDENNAAADLGQRHGEVGRRGRLSVARLRTGQHDHPRLLPRSARK